MSIVLTGVQPAEEIVLNRVGAGSPAVSGSAAWVEALFRAHYARPTGMLARLTGDRGQAEGIAADVFHKLARRPGLVEQCGNETHADLTAWIYRVATNAGFDALRTNSRRRKREEA